MKIEIKARRQKQKDAQTVEGIALAEEVLVNNYANPNFRLNNNVANCQLSNRHRLTFRCDLCAVHELNYTKHSGFSLSFNVIMALQIVLA